MKSDTLLAFLGGAALGALIALLFAPNTPAHEHESTDRS